jgi:aspartate dehydrogenase
MRIALIGFGAIGQALAGRLRTLDGARLAILVRQGSRSRNLVDPSDTVVHDLHGLLAFLPDVVVECAGHEALALYGEGVLAAGHLLVVASVGALVDDGLAAALHRSAVRGGGRLQIVAGAIAGLDALSSIPKEMIEAVRYSGVKAPAAWVGTAAERSVDLASVVGAHRFFEGSAREAARLFPRNANVVAATALAGIGLDRTVAELWVDPAAQGNVHRFSARGSFGSLDIGIRARPLAGNAKSSSLTPESLFRAVRNLVAPLVI